jgi:hypothetical protein
MQGMLSPGPGDYDCTLLIEDGRHAASLTLKADRMPHGTVHEVAGGSSIDEQGTRTWWPITAKLPLVRGQLRSGAELLLIDVRLTYSDPNGSADFSATQCIVGTDHDADDLFTGVSFQVGGLTELSGVQPIKDMLLTEVGVKGGQYGFTENADADQSWVVDGYTYSLQWWSRLRTFDPFGYGVTYFPVVEVEGPAAKAADWFDDIITPVRHIASMATAHPQPVAWVRLHWHENESLGGRDRQAQLFNAGISQQPVEAVRPDRNGTQVLIRLSQDSLSLADLIQNWLRLSDEQKTFVDLFTVNLYDRLPLRARFLTLMPALESYHATKYGEGPVTDEEHRAQKTTVLDLLDQAGLAQDQVQWLKDEVSDRSTYGLPRRLGKIRKNLPPELRAVVDAAIKARPANRLQAPPERPTQDFWVIMSGIRNAVAHGGRVQPSTEDLLAWNRMAYTLAMGVLLAELGAPVRHLVDMIKHGDWSVLL